MSYSIIQAWCYDSIFREFISATWESGKKKYDIQDNYEVKLDDLDCKGIDWDSCTFSEKHNCAHSEDVFLRCDGKLSLWMRHLSFYSSTSTSRHKLIRISIFSLKTIPIMILRTQIVLYWVITCHAHGKSYSIQIMHKLLDNFIFTGHWTVAL